MSTFTVNLALSAQLPVVAGVLSLLSGPGPVSIVATAVATSTPASVGPNGQQTITQGTLGPGDGSSIMIPPGGTTANVYPASGAILSETPPPAWVPGTPPNPNMVGADGSVPWPVKPPPFKATPPLGTTSIGGVTVVANASAQGSYTFQLQ
jgi:hypothetical protein